MWVALRSKLDRDTATMIVSRVMSSCHTCHTMTRPIVTCGPWVFCSVECYNFIS